MARPRVSVRCHVATMTILVLLSDGFAVLAEGCESADLAPLINECEEFVKKEGPTEPPSPKCCTEIQLADIPCVCTLFTEDIEKVISISKVVYVADKCGRPLAHGTHCGSKTDITPFFLSLIHLLFGINLFYSMSRTY